MEEREIGACHCNSRCSQRGKMKKLFILLLFTAISLTASKPYVILVSFDGFRWDYVNRNITPNMQNLIDTGAKAISLRPSFPSKTFPNHYSIITGMYPETHGIVSNNFRNPETGEWYSMGDPNGSKNEGKWYLGEAFWETAEKNGITTASYFWPASTLNYKSRRPTYSKTYNRDTPYRARIDTLIKWLQYPKNTRPYFSSIYFEETDDYGHHYGPNSDGISLAIQTCDSLVAYLRNGLTEIGMSDSVNIILTSDHGMTEISKDRTINIEKMLDGLDYHSSDNGPFMLIQPSEKDREKIKTILENNQVHYKFYLREEVPAHYHYSKSKRIPDFVLIADLGWFLAKENDIENWGEYSSGTHGYDNNAIDMHGIFIGNGPAFKKGYKSGTVWNIDIYPLLCKIYSVQPNKNIDGKLERISFLLVEKF